jgi:hypothetical protein
VKLYYQEQPPEQQQLEDEREPQSDNEDTIRVEVLDIIFLASKKQSDLELVLKLR